MAYYLLLLVIYIYIYIERERERERDKLENSIVLPVKPKFYRRYVNE